MFIKNLSFLLFLSSTFLSGNTFAENKDIDLKEVFNLDLLGANLKYVESLLGPAKYSENITDVLTENSYFIKDCQMLIGLEKEKVSYFGIANVDSKCSIGISTILKDIDDSFSLKKVDEEINFGDLNINYYIDCFFCGSYKADPTLLVHFEGGRAHRNYIEITASARTNTGNNYDVFFKLKDSLMKSYTEEQLYTSFNCSINTQSEVAYFANKYLKEVKIQSFFVGYKTLARYEMDGECM